MKDISKETLNKLDALNEWLSDVFGTETRLSQLLLQAGLSEDDITKLKTSYLTQYLEAVLSSIQDTNDGHDGNRRNDVMFRHFGLVDGQKETLQAIGSDLGVSRERIRQLVEKRVKLYRSQKRREKFIIELSLLAHRILDN